MAKKSIGGFSLAPSDLPSDLSRAIAALSISSSKALIIDANGTVTFEDRLNNKSFTMGITCATPGDLSVSISNNTCRYDKIGDFIEVSISLTFTLTYTTASGIVTFTGLPFVADGDAALNLLPLTSSSLFTWPNTASTVAMTPLAGTTTGTVLGQKSAASGSTLAVSAFTSGTAYTLRFRGRYRTTRV